MKVLTKIFLVLAFLIMLCLVVLTIGIHGNEAYYAKLADIEEAAIADSLDGLNRANAGVTAQLSTLKAKEAEKSQVEAVGSASTAALSQRKEAASARLALLERTYKAQDEVVRKLASGDILQHFDAASKALRLKTGEINTERDSINSQVAEALKEVQQRRTNLGLSYEIFRATELSAYLMQEQLASRISLRDRYRYASPSLQMEVGDNGGSVIGARVSEVVSDTRVEINRGSDDGVELYQYFNVMRNGRTIGTVRVDSLSNRTALATLEPGSSESGLKLQANDILQRRTFVNAGYNQGSMGGR